MTIDVYTAQGKKKGTAVLPPALFEQSIDEGLMHSALLMQQSNRRTPIAHVQQRHDVRASTRKLYRQKGTGRARRGSAGANLLRGGAKSFGPRNIRNFTKAMPKKMRRKALFSCLSVAAKEGKIIGLEGYGEDHPPSPEGLRRAGKTKTFYTLLEKLPVAIGRKIVFVLPEHMEGLERSARNVPGVKTILAPYLNPEDILGAFHLVFLVDALKKAEETFGGNEDQPSPASGGLRSAGKKEKVPAAPPKKKVSASTKSTK